MGGDRHGRGRRLSSGECMNISHERLKADLAGSGLLPGDHILVHSSLSRIGWVDGGADTVIDALIQSVGAQGTVLFPTLTGAATDSPELPPRFDARHTPCWTGKIPETARMRAGMRRSLHPTHSVTAAGRLAEWFTSGHQYVRTPCGFGSPYDKLASIGGKILLIGVTQQSNTSFHHAEEIAGAPYVNQSEPINVDIIDEVGSRQIMLATAIHSWMYSRDYDVFEPDLVAMGICKLSQLGDAELRVVDAMRLRKYLVNKLLRDPLATLAESEKVRWRNNQQ